MTIKNVVLPVRIETGSVTYCHPDGDTTRYNYAVFLFGQRIHYSRDQYKTRKSARLAAERYVTAWAKDCRATH